jgi:DUF4097 and DUF4098 domain-containing protein YvlB
MRLGGLLFLAAVLCGGQTRTNIAREGAYFVETITGPIVVPGGRLKVVATGAVVVRGKDGNGGTYTLRQRVKTAEKSEAERQLRLLRPRAVTRGVWTILDVAGNEDSDVEYEVEVTLPKKLATVALVSQGGHIEAYDLDGSIEADTAAGRIQLDRIGMNATVKTGGGPIRVGNVRGVLRCVSGGGEIQVDRAGSEVWCDTAGGNITIGEAGGPVHAVTAGNIHIGTAHSSVSAHSEGGLISVDEAGGQVTADTAGGSIQVGSSTGVRCESAAGAIRVKGVRGPLRAYTASGSILAELLPGVELQDSSLHALLGDITVYIPSNIAVSIRAWNEGGSGRGRIVSDFPEIQVRSASGRRGTAVAEGALNGGGPVLRISASGNIYLRRQK